LESESGGTSASFDDIVNLRMGEGGFRAALMTAAAESAFSESQKKIERFARVLGFELGTLTTDVLRGKMRRHLFRDLARLDEADIERFDCYTSIKKASFWQVSDVCRLDPNTYTRLNKAVAR